jgi:hypothetical protein
VKSRTEIPAELREPDQWVAWRFEERQNGAKPTKVPYQADGARADSTDPSTWTSYEEAARVGGYQVGFVLTADDPFCGIDFDGCVTDGELHRVVRGWVERLNTYAELSPSGTGVRVIGKATLTGDRHSTAKTPWGDKFEIYDRVRFLTVTGDVIRERPLTPIQAEVEALYAVMFGPDPPRPDPSPSHGSGFPGTDTELLEAVRASRSGPRFDALYRGDTSGYDSASEADLALVNMLAFWTGPDPERIDRLLRDSGLMRPKWERADYRRRTIEAALSGRAEFYSPPAPARVTVSNGEEASAGAPFALDLDEFIAARSELPPALIGDEEDVLLPSAGFVILGGKGGKGKTTLMVDAAFHLASGCNWLGFTVPRPLRVLVIENEGPQEMFRRKLEAKRESWPHEITGGVFIYTLDWGALDLRDEEKRRRLREFVEENGIEVVFGDPLDSCGLEGVGSPEDTRAFVALAKEVGLHRSVAFWFLHHPRKEKADDELEELSGAWGGRPDTVLMLSLLAGERSRLAVPKVRWTRRGKRPALILGFDSETEGFELLAEEGEERDYAVEIEELLGDREWRTLDEITAPKEPKKGKPGIGANRTKVVEALEGERFVSRPGDEVGRSARATVWGLAAWT